MASVCGRARQGLQSCTTTRNAVISKLFGSKSCSNFTASTKPNSFSFYSPQRVFSSSRLPVELGCAQSLMPLHSATSSALFTSLLSLHAQSWGSLSEGAGDLFSLDYAAESEYRMFPRGYISIIEALASVLPPVLIQLGKKVVEIEWLKSENVDHGIINRPVKMQFSDGSVMLADHVIVTVSLGVLKAGISDEFGGLFSPSLPFSKKESISRLGYGVVNKLFLELSPKKNCDSKFPFMQLAFHRSDSEFRYKKIPRWMRRTTSIYPIYNNLTFTAQPCFLVIDSSSYEQKFATDDNDKFEGHLHELDTDRVTGILTNLRRVPKEGFAFFYRVKDYGFRHNVETYMSFIKILCSSNSTKMLEAVLLEVIKSKNEQLGFDFSDLLEALFERVAHGGTSFMVRAFDALVKVYVSLSMFDECMGILYQMGNRGFVPCIFSCNFLINRLIECGKPNLAVTTYQQLKKLGLNPNVYTYNLLVKAFCTKGCLEEAVDVFKEMEEAGVSPNVFSYTTYIEGLCSYQKSDVAYELLKAWRSSATEFDNFAYDVVVRGFCNEKKLIEAEGVLVDIVNQRSIPSVYCFGALIKAYCKRGNIEKALSLESDMLSKGVKTNCVIVTSILQCLISMGHLADTISLFRTYDDLGVFLDKVCYNIAVDAMCKLGKLEEASKLLEEMKHKNLLPDLIHYSTLINGYCLRGKALEACIIFEEMKSKGFEPDIITYNILASGLARNGLFKEALGFLNSMKSRGLIPGVVTNKQIIEGLCVGGKVREAELFLSSLEVKHLDYYSSMISGYLEAGHTIGAFKLYVKLYNQGIGIKKKTCLKLLNTLCVGGELDSAFVLFKTMVVSEDNPCIIACSKLMSALCIAGDIKKAQLVFDSWFNKGLTPDTIMYTILINGYCKINCMMEAFELFKDMKSRGILPDVITYTVLLDGGFKSSLKHSSSHSKVSSGKEVKVFESAITSQMIDMQLKPDIVCYTVLIDKRCKFDGVEDAIKLFHEMMENGLQPDTVTYTALLSGCFRINDIDTAVTLVDDMTAQGVSPDEITESLLEHGLLKAKKTQFRS